MPARRLGAARATHALLGLTAVPLLLATAGPASASSVVASWAMNEPAGGSVMHDSSGNHLDGRIGAEVHANTVVGGKVGYGFPSLPNGAGPVHPGHLATVPSSARLNPGTGTFSVSVTTRFGADARFRNLMQKGQTGTRGGLYKLEVDGGVVVCLFSGSTGKAKVSSGKINDLAWHAVTCTRTAGAVTMTVDGTVTQTAAVATGVIANDSVLAIGGKQDCDQVLVDCDYFAGTVDRVSISAG